MKTEIDSFFIFLAVIVLLPVGAAYLLNRRHHRLRPNCRPFGWGYYCGIIGLVAPFLIAGFVRTETTFSAAILSLLLSLIIFLPLAILTLDRNRWAFLMLTLLSMNPLLWIINIIYLKNRWDELKIEWQEPKKSK